MENYKPLPLPTNVHVYNDDSNDRKSIKNSSPPEATSRHRSRDRSRLNDRVARNGGNKTWGNDVLIPKSLTGFLENRAKLLKSMHDYAMKKSLRENVESSQKELKILVGAKKSEYEIEKDVLSENDLRIKDLKESLNQVVKDQALLPENFHRKYGVLEKSLREARGAQEFEEAEKIERKQIKIRECLETVYKGSSRYLNTRLFEQLQFNQLLDQKRQDGKFDGEFDPELDCPKDRLEMLKIKYESKRLQAKANKSLKKSNVAKKLDFRSRVSNYANGWSNKFFRSPFVVDTPTQNALQSIPVYVILNGQNRMVIARTLCRDLLFSSISSRLLLLRDFFNVSDYDRLFLESDLGLFFMRYSDAEKFQEDLFTLWETEKDTSATGVAIHCVSLDSVCTLMQGYHPNTQFQIIPDLEEVVSLFTLEQNPDIIFDGRELDFRDRSIGQSVLSGVPLYVVQTLEKSQKNVLQHDNKRNNKVATGRYNKVWDERQNVHKHLFFSAEDALNFCKKHSQIIKTISTDINYGKVKHGRIFATNLESFLAISQINFTDDLDHLGTLKDDEEAIIKDKIDDYVDSSIDADHKATNDIYASANKFVDTLEDSTQSTASRKNRLNSKLTPEDFKKKLKEETEIQSHTNRKMMLESKDLHKGVKDKAKIGSSGLIGLKTNQREHERFMLADKSEQKRILDILKQNLPLPLDLDNFQTLYKLINEDLLGTGKRDIIGEKEELDKLRANVDYYYNNLIKEKVVRLNKNNITFVPSSRSEPVEPKPFLSLTALKMARGITVRTRILKSFLLDLWNEV